MKFRKQNDIIVDGVCPGFTTRNSFSLRTDHTPKIQIFAYSEDDEEEEPEERTYWCSICENKLVYLRHLETVWRCNNCLSYYDTKIQDTPIKDKSDFKLFAHSEHNPYATMDVDDSSLPFVQGIDPNREPEEDKGYEVTYQSGDKRIEHQRVKDMGKLMEALKFYCLNNYQGSRENQYLNQYIIKKRY
jgi:hypothetical protein